MFFYQFKVMAYGYSPAVEVVTRLLKPVKAYLHQLDIKISIFVDDGRISANSREECWEKFQFASVPYSSVAGISSIKKR